MELQWNAILEFNANFFLKVLVLLKSVGLVNCILFTGKILLVLAFKNDFHFRKRRKFRALLAVNITWFLSLQLSLKFEKALNACAFGIFLVQFRLIDEFDFFQCFCGFISFDWSFILALRKINFVLRLFVGEIWILGR